MVTPSARRGASVVASASMRPAKAVAAEAPSPVAERVNGAEVAGAGIARPDALGRFGKFGGKYVPETLMHALTELEAAFHALADDEDFQVNARGPCSRRPGAFIFVRFIVRGTISSAIWAI